MKRPVRLVAVKRSRQKLAALRFPRPQASADVLEVIDKLYDEAMAGLITSCAVAIVRPKRECGSMYFAFEGGAEVAALIGELEIVKARLTGDVIKRTEDE